MSGDGEAAGVPAVARVGEAPLQASGKKNKLGKKERGRLKAILDGSYVEPVLPVKAPAKAKQARQPYNGGMAPSLLTKYIKESWTTGALLQTCEQYHERMNKIHASASWNMLGRLAASSGADTEWFDTDRVALETLARKTTELVTLSAEDVLVDDDVSGNTNDPRMGARELANVIHGLAKSGCVRVAEDSEEDLKDRKTSEIKTSDAAATPLLSLITACALAITKRGLECNAQECANAVWGFVKVGHVSDCDLFKVLAAAATREANFGNMNPQEMVNTGWAFSRVCNSTTDDDSFTRSVASCIDAIAGASTKRLPEFDARGLCNLTCALAKSFTGEKSSNSGSQNSGTVTAALTAIATETTQRVSASKHDIFATENDVNKFSARDVALSSWAFATLDVSDEPLFLALAESSIEKCGNGEFDARGLANVAWAHAKITINESDTRQALFSFLSKALVAECDKASTATFYATTDYASENKAGMTSRDVANSAWAFAKACHPSASLFTSLCAVSTANDGLERFNNQDLVNTAWAFAKLAVKESVVLMKHARVTITNRAEDNTLTLPNICTLVWAINSCTGGGGGDSADTSTANDFASVSESLASAAERLAYESSPNELAATAWTFADAGEFNTEAHRSLFKTLSKRVSLILLNGAGGDINTSSANSSETSFGDEELDNLEWAFSKAGNPGSVLRVIKQKKKDSTGVLGMAGGKVNSRFDPSSDPSQLKSSSVPGTAKDGKSSLNGDTHGRSSPQDCGTIVVAGGGVGGAAAALALQRNGFTVVVLESDAGFDSRKQGYGLTVQGTDLRDGLGIDLSADDAPSKSHYTFNEHGEILAFYGEAFGKSSGGKQSSTNTPGASSGARFAHVPRQILRLRMLEKVAPGTIKWGCRMSNFEETHIGVKVFLDDGSTIDACLLIGSDGIFSTTRRLLNLNVKGHAQDTLTYCGLCVSLGIVYDAEFKVQLAKERIFETVDGSARVYAMPFTPGSTMWQLSFPCGEEDAKEYSRDTNKLKKKLTELTEKWHDPVPAMLLSTKIENMSGYPVYDRDVLDPTTLRPPDHKKRRVTLMGDAAHPMTPFKAQGANQAVADAVLLARCLTEGVHKFGTIAGVVESLSVFEQKMLQRANRVVKSSREKAREMHSPLALVSNRKSQRDAKGVGAGDMNMVVIRLREQGVNAKHAAAMSKQSESSGYDFDDLVEKVGFHGASLKKIVGVDSAPGDDSKKEKTSKKEKKEKKAKKAKKEKSEKRERDDDSRDKKAKKAKRDK